MTGSISEKEAIEALKEVSERLSEQIERNLTQRTYNKYRDNEHPSATEISQAHDWADIKAKAGLGNEYDWDTFTQDDAIEVLQKISERARGIVTTNTYEIHKDDTHPPSEFIKQRFEWTKLREKAGVHVPRPDHKVTEKESVEALQEVADRVEGHLTIGKYNTHRDEEHPSASALSTKFDWEDLKERAGLQTRTVTEQQAIEAIREVNGRFEGILTLEKYAAHRDDEHPSEFTLYSEFGWDSLKERMGVRTGPVTEQQAIEAFREINERVEGTLTAEQYTTHRDDKHPTGDIISNKFGWVYIKKKA